MGLRRKTVVTVISKIGDRRATNDACLVVIYGQEIVRKFGLKPGEVLIGRSSQAHLQIDHESVSRRHAKVVFAPSRVEVEDLGSTNGTYVNDEPVERRELRDGDLIKVGRTILKYLSRNNIEGAYHEEIYRLTTVDGLTRCFNKRYLREQAVREVSRAARYNRPLGIVSFDVKGFADMNEEYGHLAGDAILAQLGKRIARRIRREDIFCRYEGGEFAILAPESDPQHTSNLAERIQQIVGEGTFGFEDITIPVEVAVGTCTLDEIDQEKAAELLEGDEAITKEIREPLLLETTDAHLGPDADRFALVAEALIKTARQRMNS